MPSQLQVFDFIGKAPGDGLVDYRESYAAMRTYTGERAIAPGRGVDQLWLLEHAPVYTQGQAGKPEHVIASLSAPLVESDRGGQVTYHGPGQLMLYLMADLPRLGVSVRQLVQALENTVIDCLARYDIESYADREAPGVYVDGKKVAALGLRVKRGCCYHGLCFNYCFDATPFELINPCGYEGLQVTQLASLLSPLPEKKNIVAALAESLVHQLGYDSVVSDRRDWSAKVLADA